MQTLSFGFLLPETGDKGSGLWDALTTDISQLNSHSHNGTDSAQLSATSVAGATQNISHSSWANYSGPTGHYRQLVTTAAGYTFDANTISFRTSAGALIWPTVEKVTNTTFYIYSIDNTLDIVAVYGV